MNTFTFLTILTNKSKEKLIFFTLLHEITHDPPSSLFHGTFCRENINWFTTTPDTVD